MQAECGTNILPRKGTANSANSSIDANFITAPNDSESTILRWKIQPPLQPGDGSVLRFRVRVR